MSRLAEVVAVLRGALEGDRTRAGRLNPGATGTGLAELPGGLGELLAATDGARCGVVMISSRAGLGSLEVYLEEVGPAEDWLCFATNSDYPLYVRRDTGAVWWYPDNEHLREPGAIAHLADDVPAFFTGYVAGPGYLRIAYEDAWWALLGRAGLVTP